MWALSSAATLAGATCALPSDLSGEQVESWAVPAVSGKHDAALIGVPPAYDWARHGRIARGNVAPEGWSAMTGWGQALEGDEPWPAPVVVEVIEMRTYACSPGGADTWKMVQSGAVTGALYTADYSHNAATKSGHPGGEVLLTGDGHAFHFYPVAGRAVIVAPRSCGYLVVIKARGHFASAAPVDAPLPVMLGGGADYWLSASAQWDSYRTNKDIAIGPMKRLTTNWQWFGMSTANSADLRHLVRNGCEAASAGRY
jgi:hypothetical protein